MQRRRTLAGMVVAAALLAMPGGAAAQSFQDAACPGPGANTVVPGEQRVAHVVTPLATGKLVSAEIGLTRNAPDPSGDWLLRVSDLSGGAPTNNVLSTATIPDSAVPAGSINLHVTGIFPNPASVVAGQAYGLIVTRPAAGAAANGIRIETNGGINDTCPGSLFLSNSQSNPFVDQSPNNLVFSTRVDPPPTVAIGKHPKRKTKKRKARFGFFSNEAGARFECKLDAGAFRPCAADQLFRKLKRRRHTLQVQAIDGVGNVSAPASFSWKVKRS